MGEYIRVPDWSSSQGGSLLKYKRITLDEVETFIPAVRDTFHKIMDMPVEAEVKSSSDVKDETPVKPVVKKTSNRKGRA